jgi:hypothetical protein
MDEKLNKHFAEFSLTALRLTMTRFKFLLAAFVFALSVFFVTHLLKFPGSVAYLMEVSNGEKMLDMQPSFSTEETYRRLETFGEFGRRIYVRTIVTVDIIFPLSAFAFLFLWAKYAAEQVDIRNSLRKVLWSLAIAYVTLDFLENISIIIMLSKFPERFEFLGTYIGYLTQGKRISMIGALVLPAVFLLVAKASSSFKRKS